MLKFLADILDSERSEECIGLTMMFISFFGIFFNLSYTIANVYYLYIYFNN